MKKHQISVEKAPISVSAFLTKQITKNILAKLTLSNYDLVLIPGFVQWDSSDIEKEFSIHIKKGPEFASDLPVILNNLADLSLSNLIPANRILETSGETKLKQLIDELYTKAKENLGLNSYYLNPKRSDIIIGQGLPPPIIAEIVNCTKKNDKDILIKVEHYINSGADIIDIGCIANKPDSTRIKEIIHLIRSNHDVLISIDSMDSSEIFSAIDNEIDLILSLDLGNYKEFLDIPKAIPIVILPTKINEGYFPKDPETRVRNLFELTKILLGNGFKKLIADPLLETPITPGICNSLETYFLYKKETSKPEHKSLELPMFFGVSNVVELMDIDSLGINGLLASIAIELDMGILFTVEHSTKMMGGVAELKKCVELNFLAKHKNTPPINQGIQIFKSKGKMNQPLPDMIFKNPIYVKDLNLDYIPDEKGYFKLYVNHYSKEIYVMFYSITHKLINIFIGNNAESLSKKIIFLELTTNLEHLNYIGRELNKAELCLNTGKPYIQDA
ncbi:MAG: dihydropteroate synthase-like protein [Candidatus Lokiarchaeota archaeon]|nr:dihydropteroate synthase-like protein [Candidatus Lokiarchaeota archaeon]